MRKILFFLFICAGFTAFSQTATMSFTDATYDAGTGKFRASLNIMNALPGTPFQLGNHNLRFNYPINTLSNPTIYTNHLVGSGFSYGSPTTTGSNLTTGVMSYNIILPSATAGILIPSTAPGFNILTIEWTVISVPGLTNPANKLEWRIGTGFPNPRLAITTSTLSPGCPSGCALLYQGQTPLQPLPIEIKSFTGKANGAVNTCRWELASQKNTSHFILERSNDGVNGFRRVSDNIKAAGTTNQLMTYTTDDKSPISRGFYRLASYDFDNSVNYSAVISIDRRDSKFGIVEIAPNPTSGQVRVNYESTQIGQYSIIVTDALGRVVKSMTIDAVKGNNNAFVDISELPMGTYFLALNSGDFQSIEKIVKQ
ncbi:MAG: T9SS type A sorting domain-containing protein [Saprospiraceae bacterium]